MILLSFQPLLQSWCLFPICPASVSCVGPALHPWVTQSPAPRGDDPAAGRAVEVHLPSKWDGPGPWAACGPSPAPCRSFLLGFRPFRDPWSLKSNLRAESSRASVFPATLFQKHLPSAGEPYSGCIRVWTVMSAQGLQGMFGNGVSCRRGLAGSPGVLLGSQVSSRGVSEIGSVDRTEVRPQAGPRVCAARRRGPG